MGIFNDSLAPVTIKWTTENTPEKHDNVVRITWIEDHPTWKSQVDAQMDKGRLEDPRNMPAALLDVRMPEAGDNPNGEWKQEFQHDDIQAEIAAKRFPGGKEIWGVIRAEYFFLMVKSDKPWQKLASKMGSTGIDTLWEHPDGRIAICESKASHKQRKFETYKTKKQVAFDCLGDDIQDPTLTEWSETFRKEIRKLKKQKQCASHLEELFEYMKKTDPDCITTTVLQMTRLWVAMAVFEMLKQPKGKDDPAAAAKRKEVQANGRKVLQAAMRKSLERWFNYYGRDPFYRLPGKYRITGARSAEFVLPHEKLESLPEKNWGFPDKVDKAEFVQLDHFSPWNKIETAKERARAAEIIKKAGGGDAGMA
ncbi:MAG: hypothetical protein ABR499_02335 [Gemmatimonadaceae bacterium]